jgi:single-stranded-DNA-specific exonuclease
MLRLPPHASEEALALAKSLSLTRTSATVLLARGWRGADEAARFLEPKLAHLTAPDGMRDRDQAVERIARAARAGERVCVFGDYDADGVTAAALMTDVLRALGAEVVPVLADRFGGGYGLSDAALARVLATGATLIVTCDCGSSDHPRLDAARRAGVDAVVIDHHRVPDEALPALAFLNPHRPDCGFAYKGLASVGLALSIGAGVRARLGVALDMRRWLDLVAIGTIGDVAPLDGDNRALVRAGLERLAQGTRPGTRALSAIAGCSASTPTGEDVAYRFAPRINAPGRLDKPDLALALLLAATDAEADRLAAEVEEHCTRRKEVERAVLAEALEMLADPGLASLPGIVVAKQGWHPGVVGIVAGRLTSRFRKPSVVIALDGATGRGSARAPAGFSVYDALARSRGALLGFGGHHAAAGVEVESHRVEALREQFAAACEALGVPDTTPEFDADARLAPGDPPSRVMSELARFEPCGQGNVAPRVAIEGARVLGSRAVRGGHLRLWVDVGGTPLSCFGGELGDLAGRLAPGSLANVVGALRRDTWAGGGAIEMRLVAAEPANGASGANGAAGAGAAGPGGGNGAAGANGVGKRGERLNR